MREMPLLKELPHALAMYFAREVDNLEDAEIAQMDMLDWLSAKISDRVSASPSQRKQTNEACLAFPARLLKKACKDWNESPHDEHIWLLVERRCGIHS
jgi:hypothetical protein